MVYAVIDTNILVSAFISKNQTSATKRVVRNVFSHNIKPLYNDEILAEYSDVLHRSKFHLEDSFLVTGNLKHFPHTPQVVTAAEMMEILDNEL